MNFRIGAKEGVVIFNPKIHVADFGNFNQGFLIRKLIQNKFQGSGYVFSTFVLRKNQNKTHFGEGTSESLYYLAIMPPRIYATISIVKNLQHNFPIMRGG